ncbi:MAG: Trk system potassium transporter TrkA [Candidatus Omnitrophica bacterium]|nr:Trk system potassium transporter TrkA [Candidatus Omnitrophota bacterium]
MKIIIVGAGRIGINLAKLLAEENNDVYLIERNDKVVQKNIDKLDAQVIIGNGADPDVLKKARVQEADLVLAVTTSDETNLVVCSLAGILGAKRRIARVRNIALENMIGQAGYNQFYIDEIINPELVAAQAITKIVEAPGSSEVADFAGGRILLRAFDITAASPLCGLRIADVRDEDFPWPFLIISIIRKDSVIIPRGDSMIRAEDHIYVLLPSSSLGEFLTFVNPEVKLPKKIIIYSATITGKHVAMSLSKRVREVILLEEDAELAKEVAGELSAVRVINGSPSEADILTECGIEAADVFIATSNDDQANLVSSVLAKKMGAKNSIILSQHRDLMSITNALDIDATINPYYLAVERILRLARGRGIWSVAKFLEGETEAMELIPEEGSPITKATIQHIKFPKDSIVGAVYNDKQVVLAKGDTQIEAGKRVIVFCHKDAAKKLQALFTRG